VTLWTAYCAETRAGASSAAAEEIDRRQASVTSGNAAAEKIVAHTMANHRRASHAYGPQHLPANDAER